MTTLAGKVAIVTGAARGQGEAEARLFADHGARVVLTDILTDQGAAVAADIGSAARFIAHDVSSAEGWQQVVDVAQELFGGVDILVNNAAISRPLKLEATEPDVFDQIYRVNQFGVYLGMRAVLAPMRAAGGGSIVNVSSVAGLRGTSTLFARFGDTEVDGISAHGRELAVRHDVRPDVGRLQRHLDEPRAVVQLLEDLAVA